MNTNDLHRDDLTTKLRTAANAVDTQADEDSRARSLDHPTQLTTVDDYNSAPVGTVMSPPNADYVYLKLTKTTWVTTGQRGRFDAFDIAVDNRGDSTMDVLRWGDGK